MAVTGGLAPNQRPVIARLGIRALLAGSLANLMSAALASLMLPLEPGSFCYEDIDMATITADDIASVSLKDAEPRPRRLRRQSSDAASRNTASRSSPTTAFPTS